MKIHKITFKNINSLKGEHEVCFDQAPLSTAGIFAIVGPTGSGKSTILDVITLALFNKIPRFKKSISKNEINTEGSVMTHHTSEAKAAIEFEIKGKTYKSSWSIAKNRNGKLKDYEMTFYNPDGSVADLKRSEIPAHNEKIIGLKYEQFVKSILLSQGEFAKFLKADKHERGKLLENITGTSIYRHLGIKTYDRFKNVENALKLEKEKIGVINTLTAEERTAIESEIKAGQQKIKELDEILNKANELKQIKMSIQEIEKALKIKTEQFEQLKANQKAFAPQLAQLQMHQKLSPIQGPLTTYHNSQKNASLSKQNLEGYKEELQQATKDQQSALAELSGLTKTAVDVESFKKVMNDFETEINNLDRDLENLKKKGIETRQRINQQKINYSLPLGDQEAPDKAIALLSKRAEEIQAIIGKTNLGKKKSVTDAQKELKQDQLELKLLEEITHRYHHIDGFEKKIKEQKKSLKKYQEFKLKNAPLLVKSEALLESKDEQLKLLQRQKEDAIKIAKLEDLRASLTDGNPCPLCGAVHHPYAEHDPNLQESEVDKKMNSLQASRDTINNEIGELKKILTEHDTTIGLTKKQNEETEKQYLVEKEACEKLIADYTGKHPLTETKIDKSVQVLREQIQLKENSVQALSDYPINQELINSFSTLKKTLADYTQQREKRLAKFGGTDVKIITNRIQDDFENARTRITKLNTVIAKESDSLKRDEELVLSIAKDLQPKIESLGFSDIHELSRNFLDESSYLALSKEKENIAAQQTKIETEVKTLKSDQKSKLTLDTSPKMPLMQLVEFIEAESSKRDTANNSMGSKQEQLKRDDEDLKKIASKKELIDNLTQELEKWALLNKLIGDATGNKFANFAQGLTLQNLLVFANRRLKTLSDRYLLDMPKKQGPLMIIDKYQGNTSRSIATLSGGESFLISLALALSLSDMASRNVALDCLFIDEGFGTLDADSLESALTTLDKLQSESQKTVGVISHVEALKERIDVQIKLKKNAIGYSQIAITSQNQV